MVVLRRLVVGVLWLLVIVWAAASATFVLSHVVPADPARLAAGIDAGPAQIANVRHELGLDQPLWTQYLRYMGGLAHLDFGTSLQTRQPVGQDIARYLPPTLELVVSAFTLYAIIGVSMGVIWAVWPRGVHAVLFRLISVAGAAAPVFWIGLIFQLIFGGQLHWLPIAGALDYESYGIVRITGSGLLDALIAGNKDAVGSELTHLALPTVTLMMGQLAIAAGLTRTSLSAQLREAYVRTARARGVREPHIVLVDALRNAMNPVIAMFGVQFGFMMGGDIIVEVVFSWPGLGLYTYNAFQTYDYDPIVAVTIIVTITFVIVNSLVSAIYPILDPRLREAR